MGAKKGVSVLLSTLEALARFNPRVVSSLDLPESDRTLDHAVVVVEGITPALVGAVTAAAGSLGVDAALQAATKVRLSGSGEGLRRLAAALAPGRAPLPKEVLSSHRSAPVEEGASAALAAALLATLDGYCSVFADRSRTRVVGILNVTPDSFSDGGRYSARDAAVARAWEMVAEGADWIDIGGESTRPGAAEVPVEEELRRVMPVIESLADQLRVPISIDTRKAAVAERALAAGATIVNDVSGLVFDPRMAEVVAEAGAGLVLMHARGTPATMQVNPVYDDVVAQTLGFLRRQVAVAVRAGVALEKIWIDPGFGFGKTLEHNLSILRRLREYASAGRPLLLGTSRKSALGLLLGGAPPEERLEATAATVALAIAAGARAVRVHDVRQMARVARVADAIVGRS